MDTNITFRIDNQVKTDMAKICEQLGMTPSAAFNIYYISRLAEKQAYDKKSNEKSERFARSTKSGGNINARRFFALTSCRRKTWNCRSKYHLYLSALKNLSFF